MKELFNRAKLWICSRGRRELCNGVFMARFGQVFMEKTTCEILRSGDGSGDHFLICRTVSRAQNLARRFWRPFLDLQMSKQVARTQKLGEYFRKVSRWILCTWNAELPGIIGIAGQISAMSCSHHYRGQLGAPTAPGRSGLIWLNF